MTSILTARELISCIRQRESDSRKQAVDEIKNLYKSEPMEVWTSEEELREKYDFPKILGEPLALHLPVKENASFKGWYRQGQSSGMPNNKILYADLDQAFKQYTDQIVEMFPQSEEFSNLGKRSGESRLSKSLKPQIIELYLAFEKEGVKKHHRRKLIAKKLECSVDYVNEVIVPFLKNRG